MVNLKKQGKKAEKDDGLLPDPTAVIEEAGTPDEILAVLDGVCPPATPEGGAVSLSDADLRLLTITGSKAMSLGLEVAPRRLYIEVERLDFWELNPNEQDTHTYNLLVRKVKEQYGDPALMDQTPHVCPNPEKPGRFMVFSGNHRVKAVTHLGSPKIVVSVFFWPLQKIIEEAVSDNLVKGHTNSEQFTKLVNWYANKWKIPVEEIAPRFGFQKEADFYKNYKRQKVEELKKVDEQIKQKSKDNLSKIENLSFVLNKLFREYGNTLEQEFMFFMWEDKLHLMVWMDTALKDQIKQITDFAFDNKVDVNLLFRRLIAESIGRLDELAAELKA